jgi:hypothetical protein
MQGVAGHSVQGLDGQEADTLETQILRRNRVVNMLYAHDHDHSLRVIQYCVRL